jgi:large subunit ribosomal protein L10
MRLHVCDPPQKAGFLVLRDTTKDTTDVLREDKEKIVAELTEKLKGADTLIVADYRGLTMPQIDALRGKLLENGAKFTVVKNTLTRRAAEAAGTDLLLDMLSGPSAVAFVDPDGDAVAVAKAFADTARETKVLEIRGGIMEGRTITASDVEALAKLPPVDVLRGQVLAVIIAPLTGLAALINAPLQNLVGLIDARIDQLGGEDATEAPAAEEAPAEEAPAEEAPAEEAPAEEVAEEVPAEEEAPAEEPAAEPADEAVPEETETDVSEEPEAPQEEVEEDGGS